MNEENNIDDSEFVAWYTNPYTRNCRINSGGGGVWSNVDNSSNKLGVWVALACMFGGLGFGSSLMIAIMVPRYTDRVVQAEVADLKAQLDVAKYEASVAKLVAQRTEVKLDEMKRGK